MPRHVAPPGGDCVVNVNDLLTIISNWGSSLSQYDIAPFCAGDGVVNVNDLLAVINGWGPCCNPNSPHTACCGQTVEDPGPVPSEVTDCMSICAEADDYAACMQRCLCGIGYEEACPE